MPPESPIESTALASALAVAGWTDVKELTCGQIEQLAANTGLSLRKVECLVLAQGIVPVRYARNLGTFTIAGQQRLLASKVLVAGLGGLGGYAVEQLARSGVGALVAVDFDVFTEQNLNRQILCTTATLRQKKVDVARQRVSEINPSVELIGYARPVEQLPDDIYADLHLVMDCLDNVPARLALEARCSAHEIPLVHGAIGGWCGRVGVSWPGSELLKRICSPHSQGIEHTYGTPTVSPAVAAGLMVAQALRILLNEVSHSSTTLQWFDLQNDDWEILRLSSN